MNTTKRYRLLKDLPDAKAGDTVYWDNFAKEYYVGTSTGSRIYIQESNIHNVEWFTPITIEEEVPPTFTVEEIIIIKEILVKTHHFELASKTREIERAMKGMPPVPPTPSEDKRVEKDLGWNYETIKDLKVTAEQMKVYVNGLPLNLSPTKEQIIEAINNLY